MRPELVFDTNLQHERTSLAWERTAFAGLVVGALMTRIGASIHVVLGAIGLLQVCASASLLLWSGRHYEGLHGPLRSGEDPANPVAAKLVGVMTTGATAAATILAVVFVLVRP